jgi:hypothetical protein
VAGRFAAAGLELVNGALDELTQGEQFFELPLVLRQQRCEGQPQAAGTIRSGGQGEPPLYAIYHINIKISTCFLEKTGRTQNIS